MIEVIKNWLTEADNATYCIVRAISATAAGEMLYTFIMSSAHDYMNFGTGIAAIGAAIAAKNLSERK
jgi:hypothetical protein